MLDVNINGTSEGNSPSTTTSSVKRLTEGEIGVIDILGKRWKIKIVGKRNIDCHNPVQGNCNIYSREISIYDDATCTSLSQEQGDNYVRDLIAHEVTHAFVFESGCENLWQTEPLVTWISKHLFDMTACASQIYSSLDSVRENTNHESNSSRRNTSDHTAEEFEDEATPHVHLGISEENFQHYDDNSKTVYNNPLRDVTLRSSDLGMEVDHDS